MVRSLKRRAIRGVFTAASAIPRAVAGRPPRNDRGVLLDSDIHVVLALAERAAGPTPDELGPERARAEMRKTRWLVDLPNERLHRVEDRWIEGPGGPLALRVYTPRGGPDRLPALVYYHGGGFVLGDLESHDKSCRHLARHAGVVVVAVDYRLAPEHPFPAASDDACAAFRWVYDNADELQIRRDRIAVGGDSAGGNLAAVVCQQMRNEAHPMPAFQLLIYPATDLTRSAESHSTFAEGYLLTRQMIDWFMANYLTEPSQERDPRGSPLVTADLAGLPPAYVAVAGFDPLRDEGEAYAQALMGAGVPTTLRCYGSMVHGFYGLCGLVPAARWAAEDFAAVTRQQLWD
ncbi:alpha/beta hydrolase [bacterium AH-315-N03]|nr:alpha/beta hydrolase [bacterium AH-315-N03]